jgi:DNA-binding transcriptional MerR regulator
MARTTPSTPGTLPDKVYFRIGEVATLLGVEPHVVRFWQDQFAAVRPERSSTGRFLYSRAAVERLQRIRQLLYDEGYTIAGAKKALQSPGSVTPAPVIAPAVDPDVKEPDGRRVAELQAEVERLQRDVRATQARLEASERQATALAQIRHGLDARAKAELRQALDEATDLVRMLTPTP